MHQFNLGLSFLAGVLTTLSPCVLPVLPFVTASSFQKSKWGPVALALGLLTTFVSTTLIISASGQLLGIDPEILRKFAAALLAASGTLFLFPRAQDWFTTKLSFLTRFANNSTPTDSQKSSLFTEFFSGLLLGVVWSPCSGPSLGIALGLASQADGIGPASILLSIFGLGAIAPLLLFAYSAKNLGQKLRLQSSKIMIAKKVLGAMMILFGLLILSGLDKTVESTLTQILPRSLIHLTSQF